jgi:hypothetical protein
MDTIYTAIGVFDVFTATIRICNDLTSAGFAVNEIRLKERMLPDDISSDFSSGYVVGTDSEDGVKKFLNSFLGIEDKEQIEMFSEAMRRRYCLLSVSANEEAKLGSAQKIMQRYNSVNLVKCLAEWKQSGWTGFERNTTSSSSTEIKPVLAIYFKSSGAVLMDQGGTARAKAEEEVEQKKQQEREEQARAEALRLQQKRDAEARAKGEEEAGRKHLQGLDEKAWSREKRKAEREAGEKRQRELEEKANVNGTRVPQERDVVPKTEEQFRQNSAASIPGASIDETNNSSIGLSTESVNPVPVILEELQVGKRAVERGNVWVISCSIDTPVTESVTLREEHANIVHPSVDGPSPAPEFPNIYGNVFELRETTEEPVMKRSAPVVREEASKEDLPALETLRRKYSKVEQPDSTQSTIEGIPWTTENQLSRNKTFDSIQPILRRTWHQQPGADRDDVAAQLPAAIPKTSAPIVCHFLAEMDQQVLLNRTTTIEVIISRELVDATPGFEKAEATGEIDLTLKLLVQVVPKSNFLLADPQVDRVEIDPPSANKPMCVYFDVKGAHLGPGEIWVIVRQRQTGIVRLVLEPDVIDRAQAALTYRAKAEANATEAPILSSPLDQLLVIEQIIGDKVQYMFELDMPSINVFEQHTSKPLQVERKEYVKLLYRQIEDRYLSHYNQVTKTADAEAFTAELQAYGVTLFEDLFPLEVQAQLWKHHTRLKNIRVVSTEPFIPWEIVHLKAPGEPLDPATPSLFLGQLGLVRWLHNVNGHAPVQLRIRDGRARYVIPDYPHPDWALPETAKERAFLEAEFAATAVEPQPNEVRQLLMQGGAFDLLHFACHGEADQDNIGHARIVLQGRIEGANYVPTWLDASTVRAFGRLRGQDGTQPIVFLNACQAGRAGYKLTGIGGFAEAFLRAGAGAFIGTLWSVGDKPAFSFGKAFYEALLSGKSVPQSTAAARHAARQAGDATWLAYAVYAHPHATLARSEFTG